MSTTRYIVRDIDTQGCDFLLWGDNDPEAAALSLQQALADGIAAELVTMPADQMDPHTRHLIDGTPNPEDRMPPGPRASVAILRENGHTVTVRENRNGSLRYSVDGARETDARTMSHRFRHYGL